MSRHAADGADPVAWNNTGATTRAELHGRWVVTRAQAINTALKHGPKPNGRLEIDLAGLEALDTVGAWLVHRTARNWQNAGGEAVILHASAGHDLLLAQVTHADETPSAKNRGPNFIARMLIDLGKVVVTFASDGLALISFIGATVLTLLKVFFVYPSRLRVTSIFAQMAAVGLSAMPIVGLISFLIGVVIAFQGVDLLRTFGAEIYVVNLVGIAVLRELGILLTSIVVAGRSGSSFTAQIGSMKLREEIDAMRTLGLDPMEVLVLPRVVALTIMLPCLTFFSDMMGLAGGMMMSWATLGFSPQVFLDHLTGAITWTTFAAGMIKAPFFAVTIAVVGCMEGLLVEGSAESVGQRTTRSVVKGIFLVIVLDAAFSIFFSAIHF